MSETKIPTTTEAANAGVAEAQKKLADARATKQAEAKAAREKRQGEIDELRKSVGSKFSGGEVNGEIVGFQQDKLLGMKVADAYLVNTGNPHRLDYIFCDDFNQKYTLNK